MPAILEDPTAPHVTPPATQAVLQHRTVILKDHVTVATIIPVTTGPQSVPHGLVSFLHREFNNELERGDTYPLDTPMTLENFQNYWFGTFAAVMLLGNEPVIQEGRDWQKDVLGTFYVKPNYPGRSSHICNGGFLVCHSARGKGVGKLLGEAYLDYAPKLNYTYSVFNLVYETNVASTKIWDSLGFKRIGIIKGAGRLKGHPNPVDAIIFGRELGEDEDYVSEERFDKIRFYLEKGKYPPNADRSEKSRLRSATTHYRLEGNKLLLKDKEVISDGHQQYEIAKRIHRQNHGGINKTTALIADKYHWVRIKETVSAVIKNCVECKEHARVPVVRGDRGNSTSPRAISNPPTQQQQQQQQQHQQQQQQQQQQSQQQQSQQLPHPPQSQTQASAAPPSMMPHFDLSAMTTQIPLTGVADMDIPVDPAMMEDVHSISHHHHHPHQQHHHQLAPVAQMHAGRLAMIDGSDGTELTLGDHHNVNSSAHSAEIARAALTEEDRAMRDQLVENLQRIQDANPVNVGNLGGNVAGTHQEMDLDHTL